MARVLALTVLFPPMAESPHILLSLGIISVEHSCLNGLWIMRWPQRTSLMYVCIFFKSKNILSRGVIQTIIEIYICCSPKSG